MSTHFMCVFCHLTCERVFTIEERCLARSSSVVFKTSSRKKIKNSSSENMIEISSPDPSLSQEHQNIFTEEACHFIQDLIRKFNPSYDDLVLNRQRRKLELETLDDESLMASLQFPHSKARHDPKWTISPLPPRTRDMRLIVGDVSPSNTQRFMRSMTSDVQAVQIDFDDGHCPTWNNQITGWNNILKFVQQNDISKAPLMILRPRAWNMLDHSVLVDGQRAPGALVDFAILMFHVGKKLLKQESGPFFFLSKLEGSNEAKLWSEIFIWTENILEIPYGSIRACVLIENILASFEMEEILFELRDHSLGLNCGVWDYSASIINKFGSRKSFIIPDRSIYINMNQRFLKSYMDLVVKTCHRRGAPASGGMTAVVRTRSDDWSTIVESVCTGKRLEILAGVDGFLFYDFELLKPLQNLWSTLCPNPNQLNVCRSESTIHSEDLLSLPKGGATKAGLKMNIEIGIRFIESWIENGQGVFEFQGKVEDSATAEISRSQVWQWIRFGVKLEDNNEVRVSKSLAFNIIDQELSAYSNDAKRLFKILVTKRDFPEFITTFLNEESLFQKNHRF